ncbi:hypothetical protein LY76DRAFT_251295 [Colletotrichum caudatum]|nr:hypothetical protein LY76DRAFT_251295 [Colletotrichum caudatum]
MHRPRLNIHLCVHRLDSTRQLPTYLPTYLHTITKWTRQHMFITDHHTYPYRHPPCTWALWHMPKQSACCHQGLAPMHEHGASPSSSSSSPPPSSLFLMLLINHAPKNHLWIASQVRREGGRGSARGPNPLSHSSFPGSDPTTTTRSKGNKPFSRPGAASDANQAVLFLAPSCNPRLPVIRQAACSSGKRPLFRGSWPSRGAAFNISFTSSLSLSLSLSLIPCPHLRPPWPPSIHQPVCCPQTPPMSS